LVSTRENSLISPYKKFTWRLAQANDCAVLLDWRNDPVSIRYSKSHAPVTQEEHNRWFTTTLGSTNTLLLIAEIDGVATATTRFDRVSRNLPAYRISINVAPNHRGKGLGNHLLCSAISKFFTLRNADLVADVHQDNIVSQKVFKSAGFVETKVNGDFKQFSFSRNMCVK
jgi:L-amino acid N-acyltransferase YncA